MSCPERPVVLSSQARVDFTDILSYTRQQWGEEQRDRYEETLTRAVAALGHYPEAGERRPRLFPGCRVRFVERHIVYYRVLQDCVEIVRILHERTDPSRHLHR
jgi:toxin ParE1/3/4